MLTGMVASVGSCVCIDRPRQSVCGSPMAAWTGRLIIVLFFLSSSSSLKTHRCRLKLIPPGSFLFGCFLWRPSTSVWDLCLLHLSDEFHTLRR
jgi:hypothetical protein